MLRNRFSAERVDFIFRKRVMLGKRHILYLFEA